MRTRHKCLSKINDAGVSRDSFRRDVHIQRPDAGSSATRQGSLPMVTRAGHLGKDSGGEMSKDPRSRLAARITVHSTFNAPTRK
jgi:hypothetical protein